MRKSKYSEEQIIGFLRQAEAGMPVAEICRKSGFSDATFYKWRSKFGGMEVKLTPFYGHLTFTEEGVRSAEKQAAVSDGISSTDRSTGTCWAHAG